MNNSFKRILIAVLSTAALLAPTMVPAVSAATGPWSWNDISDKIADRQNRPVWASAYASPYWYLTDGQDLWNGGHVWKTDGNYLTDITVEVRNAGLSRVDDILSDGQTVLFVSNIVARNNNFEVLAYNGNYENKTSYLRQYLNSDEGIASITGKDNKWMIVTTKGRVILWNKNSNSMTTYISNVSSYQSDILYSVRHASPADGYLYLPVAAAPISNGWLVAVRDQNTMRFWRYDSNGSATEVTSLFGTMIYLQALTSNGTTAILAGGENSTSYANRIYTYNGVNTQNISGTAGSLPFSSWNRVHLAWNGASWMILSNKDLVRFDGTSFQSYGKTRDYFVTISANPTKTFILGGAESNDGITDGPSSPLMAKLTKVTEDGGISENSNNNTTNNNQDQTTTSGITYWTWFEPNQTNIGRDKTATYYVGTWSQSGIKRIEIVVNGQNRRTCELGRAYGNQSCSYTLYGFDYALNTTVSVNAKITDTNDQVVWTDLKNLTVSDTNNGNQTTNGDISAWNWLEPSNSTLARGNSTVLKVQANATQGLNRVEVYINGTVRRTCDFSRAYGTQVCDLTIYGNDYTNGSQLSLNAKATDYNGQTAWSDVRLLTITDSGSTNNNQNTNGDVSIWSWLEPNSTTLNRGSSTVYKVQANAAQGLNRIEVLINGTTKRYCDLVRAYGIQSCDITINGNDYTVGSQLSLNAKAMDYYGKTVWSQMNYLTITDTSGNNQNTNGDVSIWNWLEPNITVLNNGASTVFKIQANASQGLNRVEVYVNGSVSRTCNFSRVYGTQVCDLTIYGNNYINGSQLALNAKVTDYNNKTAWSEMKYITINNSTQNTGTGSTTNNSQTATWAWSTPETNELKSNANVIFNIGAWDGDGLQKIEMWVNGSIWNTCNQGNAYGNRECSVNLNGNTFPVGSDVFINAKVVDTNGNNTWTASRTYHVVADSSSTGSTGSTNTTNTPTQIWTWSTPETSTLNSSESAVWNVGAYDAEALQRIEIWVNGQIKNTCQLGNAYGNRECAYTIRANDYAAGTSVFVNASVLDGQGNQTWSNSKTYSIQSSVQNGGQNFPTDLPGNISVSSNADNGFSNNQLVTFTASANDQDGVDRIDLMINGSLVKSCYNQSTCSYTGGPYNDRATVSYGAKIVDKKGFAIWTGYRTINKK
ncbi:MAG: hypothetical protein ABIB04_04480 [Patescibacteria group bacterium]